MPTVPASKRSINQDVFTWTVPGTRKKISIRSTETMSMREIRDIATYSVDDIVALGKTKADMDAMWDLTKREFMEFTKAWGSEGATPLGK
jgi:hypothetical protein